LSLLFAICLTVFSDFGFAQLEVNEGTSLLSATSANMEAWQKGDVLMEFHRSANTTVADNEDVTGGFYEAKDLVRLVFDFESEEFVLYSLKHADVINYNRLDANSEPSRFSKEEWSATIVDKRSDSIVCNGSKSGQKKITCTDFFNGRIAGVEYPFDLRAIWFDGRVDHDSFEHAKLGISALRGLESQRITLQKRAATVSLSIAMIYIMDKKYSGHHDFVFDVASLMPVSNVQTIDFPQNPGSKLESIKIDWKEASGIFVPLKVVIEKGGPIPGMKGNGSSGRVVEQIKFH